MPMVLELVSIIEKGNPEIPIIAQISTNPPSGWQKGIGRIYEPATVEDMIIKVEAIRDIVDGVGFLLFKENDGLGRFKQFLQKIKQNC